MDIILNEEKNKINFTEYNGKKITNPYILNKLNKVHETVSCLQNKILKIEKEIASYYREVESIITNYEENTNGNT